jgi:UDP-N-acetylmuramoyl-L-alanyl-D-glutamate--2,6-diaminopimelate ligase
MIQNTIKKIAPLFIFSSYHYLLALAGAVFFLFPSRKLTVIGVTGTSGKSTTVEMLSLMLEKGGFKTASISSIGFRIGKNEEKNTLKMTMPGRFKIQRFLRKAVKAGCKFAVIEVTSQGIEQFRHKFIQFNSAIFTNLTPEHIESHGGFENYKKAKAKLFYATKNIHVINKDDPNSDYFWQIPAQKKIGFGLKDSENLLPESLDVLGKFNSYNCLAATSCAMVHGISLEICKKTIEEFKGLPGRMEILLTSPFKVIVDYAHTPEQLEKVYSSINEPKVCVLGSCGGGRDKWKRPEMGKIAKEYCKKIILTNEDPYDEDPLEIINQVAEGSGDKAEIVPDRKEAIKRALSLAEKGDAVIITGKGSEPWMCVKNGKKIPWDDREIVRRELLSRGL